jgi:dTDP-4-dehydrorhamnose 3,5-epimerase
MKFMRMDLLSEVLIISLEPAVDFRGFFARTYCRDEFLAWGIREQFVQCSVSYSLRRGTLRGLHFQRPPSREAKLVRCTRGTVLDVVVDIRAESPTVSRWKAIELSAKNHKAVYVPPGFAHGLQTLEDDTEVLYQMTDTHAPHLADGVRWDDPAFGVKWPILPPIVSARDAAFPEFRRNRALRWRE